MVRSRDNKCTDKKCRLCKQEIEHIKRFVFDCKIINKVKTKLKSKTTEEISKATGGFGIPGFKWPI